MNCKIAFLMYPVSDIEKSVAFYRDAVGLTQKGMNEAWWVEFDLGGQAFGIGNVPDNGVPGTAQSLVLEVDDIKSFAGKLRNNGIEVPEPTQTPYSCWISGFNDPDGNKVWLHQASAQGSEK